MKKSQLNYLGGKRGHPKRILVVDDEESLVRLVSYNLQNEGFEVFEAYDGLEAVEKAQTLDPDLIILDIMLPGMDGLEVCRALREGGSRVPIVMLTARDRELDTILGLELGADDYVAKPFSPRVLMARIKAVLRRAGAKTAGLDVTTHTVRDLTIEVDRREVLVEGRRVSLTAKEFDLLEFMVRNAGRVLTRAQMLQHLWDYEFLGDTRNIDVHISHLRDKIEKDPRNPVYIKTVRGVGYVFEENPRKN